MPATPVVDILLLDLPVALWASTRARTDLLLSALEPVAAAKPRSPAAKLVKLVARLDADYAEVSAPSELELRAAAARRLIQVDVAYGVVREARDDLATLIPAYDAADRWCRDNDMAAVATPPEEAAFRRWFLGQIVAQLDGAFPTPWKCP